MIFKVPEIEMDGVKIVNNLKANINILTHQARIKGDIIGESARAQPVDIIIDYLSTPSVNKFSTITSSIKGRELLSGKSMDISIGYNFIKQQWKCSGVIGVIPINETVNQIADLIRLLKKLC